MTSDRPITRHKMDRDSSADMVDVGMASVNGSMSRDGDYMKGVIFSDGASRGELDECAVSLGLTKINPFSGGH